jgi:hypothetical protein
VITVDSKKCLVSLIEARNTIKKKLENVVRGFAYEMALTAIQNTPIGTFNQRYKLDSRVKFFRGVAKVGAAKGGWTIGFDSTPNPTFDYASGAGASNIISKIQSKSSGLKYNLGEKVYIANYVPYLTKEGFTLKNFSSLENGYSKQAPQGIMIPTLTQTMGAFSVNLKKYYEQG